jgi:small-conductance mechanosensitive channel
MTWDEILALIKTGWIMGPAVFLLWCAAAFGAKSVIFNRVHAMAKKTSTRLDDILLTALNLPLNLFIVIMGLSIVAKAVDLTPELDRWMGIASKTLIILCVIFLADRLIKAMLIEHDERVQGVNLSQGVIQGLIRSVVFIIGALVLLDSIGISITPLIASLGVGTLAVALALQSTLANFFAGLFITMDKSVKVGDFVQLETGEIGKVEDIGWRTSRVRMRSDNLVVIPNDKLVNSTLTNFNFPHSDLYTVVECGVHYDSDLDRVEETVLDVANKVIREQPGAVKDEKPRFRFSLFDASSVNFRIKVRCTDYDSQFRVQHHLIKAIHKRFSQEGITIPYPIQTLDLAPRYEKILESLAGASGGGKS